MVLPPAPHSFTVFSITSEVDQSILITTGLDIPIQEEEEVLRDGGGRVLFFLSPQVEISLGHTLRPSWSGCAGPARGYAVQLWAEYLACLHLHP